jgi:isoleucyl-tRNA synthetase
MEEFPKNEASKREEEILKKWNSAGIFKKTLEKHSPNGEFVFYEGPPTANGRPGIHHLIPRVFKDVIPRYKTMRGFHVRRKAGWDTHGLPVEIEVEKKLGLTSKKQIEEYGIAAFNEECKKNVWNYIDEWHAFTERIGYWLDLDDAYITYYPSYIESLWHIIAQTNKQGLLYKDYKVVPWCPRCETGLSSHELALGYEDVKDISVYVKFKVKGEDKTYFLAWTTTPWTLPGNVALAVGEHTEYVKVSKDGEFLWLAKARLSALEGEYEVVEEVLGNKLIGKVYEPLYPYTSQLIAGTEKEKMVNAYKVYSADFVTIEDGTGIVHTAVMYGQEDFELGQKVGLPKHHLVGEDGRFIAGTGQFAGRFVRDEEVAVDVIKDLHERGLLLKKEAITHTYPHCWRCHTALIYYARNSWYIRMSSLRDKMVSENQRINWIPQHIKEGRFGEWLREVKDWAISRDRYWGTPLPLWQCECGHTEVVGSKADFKKHVKTRGNTFYFVRHGQADNNVKNICASGVNDPYHLTQKGKEQIKRAGRRLSGKGIRKIFVSPFIRTRETAEILRVELGLSEKDVIVDERLTEIRYGDIDGKSQDEFARYRNEHLKKLSDKIPGGESFADVRRRLTEFIYEQDAAHENEAIAFVTHGIGLELAPAILEGADDKYARELVEQETNPGDVIEAKFIPLPHNRNFEVDLHKPYIDEIQLVCPSCGKDMKRTSEVIDVWFDSGAMPFAQDHYPFEGGKRFWQKQKIAYPANYISEAVDQTRGWFYTLHAIGALTGRGRAYENVICLGHILDAKGKKMSKSLGNTVNPWEMIAKYGVDVIRFWMYSVNQPGDSKNFDEKTVDEVNKKVFNILRNVMTFYQIYADDSQPVERQSSYDVYEADHNTKELDRWIITRLNELVRNVTDSLEVYDVFTPTRAIKEFANDLSTWYIRRSRDRFKEGGEDAQSASATTRYVLFTLSKLLAPFIPFFAEEMYQVSGGSLESVHLEEWPKVQVSKNEEVLRDMEDVRTVVSRALEARMASGIKVRQPLSRLFLNSTHATLRKNEELQNLIKEEINVKEIVWDDTLDLDVSLDTNITPELQKEGDIRELVRAIQDFRKESGLTPSDSPNLRVTTDERYVNLIEEYKDEIERVTKLRNIEAVVGKASEYPYLFELH